MSEQVHVVTDLPTKTAVLKKFAKRTAITSVLVVAAAAVYLKTQSKAEVTPTETPTA